MKKIIYVILISIVQINYCYGQDKITRRDGTSFDCKIFNADSSKLYFKINTNSNSIKTYLKYDEISSYEYQGTYIQISELDTALVHLRLIQSEKNIQHNIYNSSDKRSSKNALNMGFMGFQKAVLSFNYERLIDEKYGFVIGVTFFNSIGVSLNLRNHIKNSMNSFYWGLFANYLKFENVVNATGYDLKEYRYKMTNICVGPNIGKRWITKSGVNFALRLGYGFPINRKFEWIDIPEDETMKNDSKKVINTFAGFDSEISIGYCF